eukprot:866592-Prorocentrum_minimum.AAC.4
MLVRCPRLLDNHQWSAFVPATFEANQSEFELIHPGQSIFPYTHYSGALLSPRSHTGAQHTFPLGNIETVIAFHRSPSKSWPRRREAESGGFL